MNKATIWNLFDKAVRLVIAGLVVIVLSMGAAKDGGQTTSADSSLSLNTSRVRTFLPTAQKIEAVSENGWSKVYDNKGGVVGGYTLSHPFVKGVIGYAGEIPLMVVVDVNGKIVGVDLLENRETRSFITRIRKAGLLESWNGKTADQAAGLKVDAVAGATYSSEAIKETLGRRLAMLGDAKVVYGVSKPFGVKELLAGCVLAAGLVFFIMGKKLAKYRWVLLAASVTIAGFVSAKMLSTELFYSWITTGFAGHSVLHVIVIVAIGAALVTNKNFYCNYYCPFGCGQELASKILKRKPKLPSFISRNLGILKRGILAAVLLCLILRVQIDLGQIEPFSAFLLVSASRVVLAIAGVFLVLSVFFPRIWCRGFCPTGAVIDFFAKTANCNKKEVACNSFK